MAASLRTTGMSVNYELPTLVESIRTGWQLTSQGSAVVSGLLAAVAAQLLSFFQSGDAFNRRQTSQGGKDTVLALCYVALLLNIAATISALLIIDKMGALPVRGASLPPTNAGHFPGNPMHILGEYGGSRSWRYVIWHWLLCFLGGVVCLVVLILVFIWHQEPLSIRVVVTGVVGFAIIPSLVFLVIDF